MLTSPPPRTSAPHLPFKYLAGDPALELVNTVDWTTHGPVEDRLTDYARLLEWAEGAELLAPRLARHFRELASRDAAGASAAHRDAVELRWVLRQLFARVASGDPVGDGPALDALNVRIGGVMSHLRLAGAARSASARQAEEAPIARWTWRDAGHRLDSVLWPVVRAAADLLVSEEAGRVRECGGTDCGWLYVDRSRNGLRRWCQMETCGTREKSRRRALRRDGER
jgi:predicted RNA-binding Zn ribbon-like protein